ncbi:MAG: hypothetical protein BWY71_02418 [Planctomycetes bacterium ADurb.Bin412]|nr:MAG: hypothetical protein BWY71_02418 [Planctomycetes bacterium ADurb.Bin412]
MYERGTRASGGQAGGSTGGADVLIAKRTGAGRSVYLNLTPVAYFDMDSRLGEYGTVWREIMGNLLKESGLAPRVQVLAEGKPVPLAEAVFWRKEDKMTLGIIKNPTRKAATSEAGAIHGVTGEPMEIQIVWREPAVKIRNLRSGESLPDGTKISVLWKPWEAVLLEYDAASATTEK